MEFSGIKKKGVYSTVLFKQHAGSDQTGGSDVKGVTLQDNNDAFTLNYLPRKNPSRLEKMTQEKSAYYFRQCRCKCSNPVTDPVSTAFVVPVLASPLVAAAFVKVRGFPRPVPAHRMPAFWPPPFPHRRYRQV